VDDCQCGYITKLGKKKKKKSHDWKTYLLFGLICITWGQWNHMLIFFVICMKQNVATPFWASVGVKPNTPKVGDLESFGTFEYLEFDSKSQNTSHWAFGHLQPKLWAKERLGVKLFPGTKSWESTSS
jgi:hypothetical protein